ncbi:hypothetical protein BJ166DRAFT_521498 [Pestalotiopsis sp. NC0098]|nr:hypothetical protein BJ166DRAFT_521498 [Pestalotiopsis sp. NC0098]
MSPHPTIEDFGLTRIVNYDEPPNKSKPDLSSLTVGLLRNDDETLRHYRIVGKTAKGDVMPLHDYSVSVAKGAYVVSTANLADPENPTDDTRRQTRMRLHEMIIANYEAAGGDPSQLQRIIFPEILSPFVQAAIFFEWELEWSHWPGYARDGTRMGKIRFTQKNPLSACVDHLVSKVNAQRNGLDEQDMRVRFYQMDAAGGNWQLFNEHGYNVVVMLGIWPFSRT